LGDCDSARIHIDEAEMLMERLGDSIGLAAITLQRGFVELAQAAQAGMRGDSAQLRMFIDAANARVAQAGAGNPPLVEQSDDARSAIRLMTAWRDQLDPERGQVQELSDTVLLLGPDAQWFRPPGGEWVDMRRKKAARAILNVLADHHRHQKGVALATETLVEAGWPDEQMVADAGINRVHVALNQLRKLGLKECIVRTSDGYLLDSALETQRVTSDWKALVQEH